MTAVIYVQIGFNKEIFFVLGPYHFNEKNNYLPEDFIIFLF